MKRSAIREEVLGSAVEDYHGLYEIIWGLRGLLLDRTERELKSLAEDEIRELLAGGKVALYRRTGTVASELLHPEEIEAALADQTNWTVPANTSSVQILVGATEKGRDYWKSSAQMKSSVIRDEVLDSLIESSQPLWEITSRLPGLLRDKTNTELKALAEDEIRKLLDEGYVALYRRTGPVGEAIRLQPEEIEAALARETNWKVPPEADSEEILVGATDLGEAEYYSGTAE